MTGKTSPRVGEARDTAISHYVFEAPVRLWHWLTVGCMLVLMVTGYFIGRPLPSVSGEATYLFYMGDIRLIHFSAAMVFTVILLMRIYWAFVGNRYSRELFIVPVWRRSWWRIAESISRPTKCRVTSSSVPICLKRTSGRFCAANCATDPSPPERTRLSGAACFSGSALKPLL